MKMNLEITWIFDLPNLIEQTLFRKMCESGLMCQTNRVNGETYVTEGYLTFYIRVYISHFPSQARRVAPASIIII